ncbi:MAG: AmmeMemoRadiSam system protein A [Patescibacteria group bacterium]
MNFYIELAKSAVETYIKEKMIIAPPKDLPQEFFKQKAGVFVTIMNGQNLRGCIGTYLPIQKNIAQEIIQNAIAAATQDFRFNPISQEELSNLFYSVYILDKPKQIKDINELNPKQYGVLIKSENGKSGLLLPDLDGIDTVEKQLHAVCMKCGIIPGQEKVIICKFKAKKYT